MQGLTHHLLLGMMLMCFLHVDGGIGSYVGKAPCRAIFRVLRADEEFNSVLSPRKRMRPGKDIRQEAKEHVTYGSKTNYSSAVMSFTAELRVALAFAGPLSRVAVTDASTLRDEDVFALDKDYLRETGLSDTLARARSRRSDEILVAEPITSFALLDMEIVKCNRKLAPGFEDDDKDFFPSADELRDALTGIREGLRQTPIGGSNKRMFRVSIGDRWFVAHHARPNVCLDSSLLFGEDLVKLSRHEFAGRCCFRELCPNDTARGAHYEFELRYGGIPGLLEPSNENFKWALTLIEDVHYPTEEQPESFQQELQQTMERLFTADTLLGNWACINNLDAEISTLCSPEEMVYARRRCDNKIVRLMADRSLGCTYSEDIPKKDEKNIVPFTQDNALYLREVIGSHPGYSLLNDVRRSTLLMDLQLHSSAKIKRLRQCLAISPWPKLIASCQKESRQPLWGILKPRIQDLLQTLPYKVLEPLHGKRPPERDGHAAVAVNSSYMFIFGGNSPNGPLADTWRYDKKKNEWLRFADLPSPRYSHSGLAFDNRWLISFGGCGNGRSLLSELLVMDLMAKSPMWFQPTNDNLVNGAGPEARCRHGSVLMVEGSDKRPSFYVVAGHTGTEKLGDIWRGLLDFSSPDSGVTVRWTKYRDLSRKCHRHFVFLARDGSSLVVLGGFGQSLMKLRVVKPFNEAGQIAKQYGGHATNKSNKKGIQEESDVVTTSDALQFNIFEEFIDSKSLAGFAAIVDDTSRKVFLFGGGNVGASNRTETTKGGGRKGGAFGRPGRTKTATRRPSRALILNSRNNSLGVEEWSWSMLKDLTNLPENYQLPLWNSWTGCLLGDEVLLFGGRSCGENDDDLFSNTLYSVRVRKSDSSGAFRARIDVLCNQLNQLIQASPNPEVSSAIARSALRSLTGQTEEEQAILLPDYSLRKTKTNVRILCTLEGPEMQREAAQLTDPDVLICSQPVVTTGGISLADYSSSNLVSLAGTPAFYRYRSGERVQEEVQDGSVVLESGTSTEQQGVSSLGTPAARFMNLPEVGLRGLTVAAAQLDDGEQTISSLVGELGHAPHLICAHFSSPESQGRSSAESTLSRATKTSMASDFLLLKGYTVLETSQRRYHSQESLDDDGDKQPIVRRSSSHLLFASPSLVPRLRWHSLHDVSTCGDTTLACLDFNTSKRLVGICGPQYWGESEAVEEVKAFCAKQNLHVETVRLSVQSSSEEEEDGLLKAFDALRSTDVVLCIGQPQQLLKALPALDMLFVVTTNAEERKRRFHIAPDASLGGDDDVWYEEGEKVWSQDFKVLQEVLNKESNKNHEKRVRIVNDEADFVRLFQEHFHNEAIGSTNQHPSKKLSPIASGG